MATAYRVQYGCADWWRFGRLAAARVLALVLGELFRREFASLHVALVQLRVLLLLLRQVVQSKNRGHRTPRS